MAEDRLIPAAPAPRRGVPYPKPSSRRFRVYALDPQAALSPETATANKAVIALPWEAAYEDPLTPGPTGEYLEVIDFDAPATCFYAPLDPNHPDLLAQDGLPPSEGRPQFHQQMAYAVAMKTIRGFERALGRKVLWSSHAADKGDDFIQRLRIFPHALAEANAYYSPEKTALLFGYFKDMAVPGAVLGAVPGAVPGAAPGSGQAPGSGGWVFTCLSHDIIAHETAHAILHGMHRRSIEAIGPDTLAFHEGFADIVAILQHFTMAEMVAHQIAATSGRLQIDQLLSGLAGQFGAATRAGHALRSGIDRAIDPVTQKLGNPDPSLYATTSESHARGAILVGAVFDAFLTIFEQRTGDLMRLATGRSTPTGDELAPDLVKRLADEAAKTADQLLRMCVRGLDYLPVTDVSFGEYLRAILTADRDLVPEDPRNYRVILTDAFRRRGIYQRGWLSMAPDSLYWDPPETTLDPGLFAALVGQLDLTPRFKRSLIHEQAEGNRKMIHKWLMAEAPAISWEELLGIRLGTGFPASIPESTTYPGRPAVEVHSARMARRSGPDGEEARQLIIEITQRRFAFDDPVAQDHADIDPEYARHNHDFIFRGGATLIIDLTDKSLRYAIRKRIDDKGRLERQREWRRDQAASGLAATYFASAAMAEPFAFAHRQ